MKRILICLLIGCIAFPVNAQNKYADSLRSVLAHTTKPIDRFSLLVKLGEDNFSSGNSNVDSFACIQMHQIAKQLNSDSLLAMSYNWIGDYFLFNKADNTSALEYLFKGIPLAEKAKNKRTISSLYLDIALAYFNLNNPEAAIKYIRRAGDNLPDSSSLMYDYMARQYQSASANYYILQHQPDSALHFINELNETNLRLKSSVFESRALGLSAAAYDQLGDEQLAEIYYRKANILADATGFYNTKLFVKKKYALFLLHNNKMAEAGEQARELLEVGRQISNNSMQLAGAGFLRQVYENRHFADSAYYYSEMESSLKDSIFSQNNINKIQALSFNEQLRIIDEAAKNKAEIEGRKQNIEYALIAMGIVIFIILFLLLSRRIITNTKVIEFLGVMVLLIVFEFLDLLLNPFLEKLTNNTPVLMLLALVCMASLLIPTHYRLEKWTTKKLIEKNKQIRLAAAKKTIRLLSGETLENNRTH